ncbi:MAG: enoyl-CoA hydratase/isomerase family protein [Deltaproteobacteria bacterium]|nr:MAG: enoyl-CoA hydratase/isomerase family protein [Deltaproteobacteria bacterium]
MNGGEITLERRGKIAVLTLNRPDRLNAFNEAMWDALDDASAKLHKKLPRVIVLTGAGSAFSAGFDVNPDNPMVGGLAEAVMKKKRPPVDKLVKRIRTSTDRFVFLPVPIIAAVNGLAYGGGAELSSRCDIRILDPSAVISFSEVKLGLIPDWGGGVALTRLVGTGAAADIILTGRKLSAEEALRVGFATKVSEPGKVLDEATAMAETIAKNGPRAVRAALAVIRNSQGKSLLEALDFESDKAADLIASGECAHGITSFMNKREPDFPDID